MEGWLCSHRRRRWSRVLAATALACLAMAGCDEPSGVTNVGIPATDARLVFVGSTTRRSDLSPSAVACANAVVVTHAHPSWRNFDTVPLPPVPPDRYEITFTDIPINTRVSFRVNDQNFCDENATGAVTRNVFVNNVRLVQNTTTPGTGEEPGFAFTLAPNGTVTQ
jgi:hypothetical protein